MRAGWNGVEPATLPPLRRWERLRLGCRGVFAALSLALFFALFLIAHGFDRMLAALGGRPVGSLGTRVVRAWARTALWTLGLRCRVEGRPMAAPGAFVANHASWIDIPVLQATAAPFLVSKAEVRAWPVIGTIAAAVGTMFIDRRPTEAKRQEEAMLRRLGNGDRMALFPEGTSTDGRRVLPFKSTLFSAFFAADLPTGLAVQPVTIRYHPRASLPPAFYGWWGEMDFASHARDVLARSTHGRVDVIFHPAIPLGEVTDRKALAREAETATRTGFERLG